MYKTRRKFLNINRLFKMPKKVIIIEGGVLKKKCTDCQEVKQLGEFYSSGKKKDGSRSQMGRCKKCYNKHLRRNYVPKTGKVGRPVKYM